jgi:leucine-rich repeat-containing protein 49
MIGKNNIERIRNLQSLTRLDVLDLHSNKITKIENLNNLSELRVLNLANNQITIVDSLTGLASLTELNLRRNSIEVVSSLAGCPKLQRLFLSSNKITKFEDISGLADVPQLTELALDGNPICTSSTAYYKFCFKTCPGLKNIDLNKVTNELKTAVEEGKLEETNDGAKKPEQKENAIKKPQEETKTEGNTLIENTVKDNAENGAANVPAGGDMLEISQENLMKVIMEEWTSEVARLKAKYPNGIIDWKREGKLRSLIQSGHAEIEGDTILFIYGNALEVLSKVEFQRTVEQINFQYVLFDNIVSSSNLAKLCKFQKLSRLVFSYNYLNSFLAISKLESLQHLTTLTIENNVISKTVLFKNFIVYRFNKLTHINGNPVAEIDRQLSRKFFESFNHLLYSSLVFKVIFRSKK